MPIRHRTNNQSVQDGRQNPEEVANTTRERPERRKRAFDKNGEEKKRDTTKQDCVWKETCERKNGIFRNSEEDEMSWSYRRPRKPPTAQHSSSRSAAVPTNPFQKLIMFLSRRISSHIVADDWREICLLI